MRKAKISDKPSPLVGEGRVRGVLPSEIHPHPGPLPSRKRGKGNNRQVFTWFALPVIVPKNFRGGLEPGKRPLDTTPLSKSLK
jgi:hypothetical protein